MPTEKSESYPFFFIKDTCGEIIERGGYGLFGDRTRKGGQPFNQGKALLYCPDEGFPVGKGEFNKMVTGVLSGQGEVPAVYYSPYCTYKKYHRQQAKNLSFYFLINLFHKKRYACLFSRFEIFNGILGKD